MFAQNIGSQKGAWLRGKAPSNHRDDDHQSGGGTRDQEGRSIIMEMQAECLLVDLSPDKTCAT